MKKRILGVILTVTMIMGLMSGLTLTVSAAETITPSKPATDSNGVYQIGTAAELYWFAGLVNGTLTDGTAQNVSANAKLIADITVNENVLKENKEPNSGDFIEWVPIGNRRNSSSVVYYKGNFDGNNKTIRGLYSDKYSTSISDYPANYVAFIGAYSNSSGTVKNLTIEDSYFSGAQWVAGIVGVLSSGTIDNCVNKATVKIYQKGGGITGGSSNLITVSNCRNDGLVMGFNSVGGIIYELSHTSVLKNCLNTGEVRFIADGKGGITLGGVVAKTNYYTSSTLKGPTIKNCGNTGNIVVGREADSNDKIGGFVGSSNSIIAIENCYSTGKVIMNECTSSEGIGLFGGYVGYNSGNYPQTVVSNCYYNSEDTSFPAYGKGSATTPTGATARDFESGKITYLLNASSSADDVIWKQTLSTDIAPSFDGLIVYYDGTKYYNIVPELTLSLTSSDVTIENLSEDAVLVVASYKNKKMVDVKTIPVSGDCTKSISSTGLDVSDYHEIKAFLWKDLTSPKPLCEGDVYDKT